MIKTGFENAIATGYPVGFPLKNIEVEVTDLKTTNQHSPNTIYNAIMQGILKTVEESCSPIILEPIMKVEMTVIKEYDRFDNKERRCSNRCDDRR